jgi:hypothetical protein
VPILILLLLLPVVLILLTPLTLVQRYRVGTARRQARPWLATFGLVMMVGSTIFFLAGAAITSFWVQDAFLGALAGIGIGVGLGTVGVLVLRWEATPGSLHYTPNKWLVLSVILIVSVRLLYGLYQSQLATAESVAAGGVVIGYYLGFSAALRWRIKRWENRALRRM